MVDDDGARGPGRRFREKRSSTLKVASFSYQAKGPPDFFFRCGAIRADRSGGGDDENNDDSKNELGGNGRRNVNGKRGCDRPRNEVQHVRMTPRLPSG